jgi:putative inorganic carbon (hco3(-)) transporter
LSIESIHITSKLHSWVKKELIQKKFLSPWGILLLLVLAVGSGILATTDLFLIPIALGIALSGIVIVYYCLFKPLVGFYIINLAGFFVFYPNHIAGHDIFPLNSGLELLILILFIGTLISQKSGNIQQPGLLKTGVSITLLILTLYVAMEAFNPNVYGFRTWFTVFKRTVSFVLIYLSAYYLIDTKEKLRFFIRFWIILSFITALYGCYQQWFGYFPFELNYIRNRPTGFTVLFQGGQLRKFSFLGDVTTFGVTSGCMSLLTLILAINEKIKPRRYLLFFISLIMALGMSYSGTRTATIIIPAGLILYILITIQNKTTLVTLFMATLVAIGVLFAPIYSSSTLNRIRSTFDTRDESLNVRNRNRHYIQPYLHSHPIGGGIGTTNSEGVIYHPYHPLAGFATDSGFLIMGLEMGWIGLALLILFNLFILYQGINYYFKIYDKELKLYVLVFLCTVFAFIVTQYSQENSGQFPFCIFFYSSLSLMKRLLEFDEKSRIHQVQSG